MPIILHISISKENYATPLLKHYDHLNSFQQSQFKQFVKDELNKRSNSTINNWFRGDNEPSTAEKKLIAGYFKVNQETLFPTKK